MIGEVEFLSTEEREAFEQLARVAAHCVNLSPAGRELAGSGFAAKLNAGKAGILVEVTLPAGPIRILARTDDDPAREVTCINFPQRRSGFDA